MTEQSFQDADAAASGRETEHRTAGDGGES
jgi:hypothetical protein